MSNKKRKKQRGRKAGHEGARRAIPDKVDDTKNWFVGKVCPFCGDTKPKKFIRTRTRHTEDIARKKSLVIRHNVENCRCGNCKKIITDPMTDALLRSSIGLNALVLSAWQHAAS